MIVDAHHHLWDLSVRDQDWITDPPMGVIRRSFLEPDYLAAAPVVSASVLVQTIPVAEETPEFLAVAASSDVVGAVVGWTDLTSPGVGDALAALTDGPDGSWLRGIRHPVQGEADPEWLCRKDVWNGLAAGWCGRAELRPVDVAASVACGAPDRGGFAAGFLCAGPLFEACDRV